MSEQGRIKLSDEDITFLKNTSKKTEEEIKQIFDDFFEDFPSGKVEPNGVKKMMDSALPEKYTEDLGKHIFHVYDINGDGVIDFKEFMMVYYLMSEGSPEDVLSGVFRMFDLDGNGMISVVEVTRLVTTIFTFLKSESPELETEQFVAQTTFFEFDEDGDGRVSREEFVKSCLAHEDFTNKVTNRLVNILTSTPQTTSTKIKADECTSKLDKNRAQMTTDTKTKATNDSPKIASPTTTASTPTLDDEEVPPSSMPAKIPTASASPTTHAPTNEDNPASSTASVSISSVIPSPKANEPTTASPSTSASSAIADTASPITNTSAPSPTPSPIADPTSTPVAKKLPPTTVASPPVPTTSTTVTGKISPPSTTSASPATSSTIAPADKTSPPATDLASTPAATGSQSKTTSTLTPTAKVSTSTPENLSTIAPTTITSPPTASSSSTPTTTDSQSKTAPTSQSKTALTPSPTAKVSPPATLSTKAPTTKTSPPTTASSSIPSAVNTSQSKTDITQTPTFTPTAKAGPPTTNSTPTSEKTTSPTSTHTSKTKPPKTDTTVTPSVKPIQDKNINLINSSKVGDLLGVKKYLKEGADVMFTETSEEGMTAFLISAREGHEVIVKEFLNLKKIDINMKTKDGTTALMFAAEGGHVEIVMMLADRKAKLDMQNGMGWSALMYSAKNGHIDVLCMLLKRGANPNLVTPKNDSALMIAAHNCKSDIMKVLLASKFTASVDIQDEEGWSALMKACSTSDTNEESVSLLLEKGAKMDLVNQNNSTALMLAILCTRADIVTLLLKKGADVNLKNKQGENALEVAVRIGDESVLKALRGYYDSSETSQNLIEAARARRISRVNSYMSVGAELEFMDENGETAFHRSALLGHSEMMEAFLKHDVDVNLKTKTGWTALMWASEKGHIEIVRNLVSKGANVDCQHEDFGVTALMMAAREGMASVVSELLENNANVELKDKWGKSVKQWAGSRKINILLDSNNIKSKDKDGSELVEIAAKNGNIKVLNTLLKRGARYEGSKENAGDLIKRLCEVTASKSNEDKRLDEDVIIQTFDKLKQKEKKKSLNPKSKRLWKIIRNNLEKSKGRDNKKENKTIDISFDKSFDTVKANDREENKKVKGDLIEYHKSFDHVKENPKNSENVQEEDDSAYIEVDVKKVDIWNLESGESG